MVSLLAVAFTLLYHEVTANLISDIAEHIRRNMPFSSASQITDNLEYLKSRDLVITGAVILAVTTVVGYLTTQLALKPIRDALEAQKQFIGNVAHELRTPLSIVKTNTEVRLFDTDIPPRVRAIHEDNLEELNRISNIINNLLSLSNLTRRAQMPFANVDLGAVAKMAIGHFADLARKKSIAVTLTESDYRTVWGNESALEQVVMNVLKNALNYTKGGGEPVAVTIRPDHHGAVELVVEDSGIGINEKDLYRIFEPFYRGDQSRKRDGAGSGLGLTIVNELLKAHHGRMSIKSARHRGTIVTITLPPGKEEPEKEEHLYDEVAVDFSNLP